MMRAKILWLSRQYERGLSDGQINVFNPGILFGNFYREYMRGYKQGRLEKKDWPTGKVDQQEK